MPPSHPIVVVVLSDAAAVTQVWKQALAHFDKTFDIPIDQTANWPNVTVTKRPEGRLAPWCRVRFQTSASPWPQSGALGLNAHDMLTPFTIGYGELSDAQDSGPAIAAIRRGDAVVRASGGSPPIPEGPIGFVTPETVPTADGFQQPTVIHLDACIFMCCFFPVAPFFPGTLLLRMTTPSPQTV